MTPRRFPPPWTVVEHPESFWVQDAGGQTVGWFYFRHNEETARQASSHTSFQPEGTLASAAASRSRRLAAFHRAVA
jgi:hypothetical protein